MRTPPAKRSGLSDEADRRAELLAVPEPPPDGEPWLAHSLSQGTAGIALLHIERAHAGHGTWQTAHEWITGAVAGEVSASDSAGLFLGLPAVAFMLDAATSAAAGRYRAALAEVDRHLARLALRRAGTAMARIRAGQLPGWHEYDLLFGLTGLGALLMRRDPGGSALGRVLEYLVALARPLIVDGQELPGWWACHDPHRRSSPGFPGGHGNFGAAHGISGPLALLGQAARRGIAVDGQREAISAICGWLSRWRQDSSAGPWWPEWISMADLRAGRPSQAAPNRPSWCYGTPGIARAGQVASIAIGDDRSRRQYEDAFAWCLQDDAQQARITEAGLCHGAAGLYMTAWRAAGDAATPALAALVPRLADRLQSLAASATLGTPGFLDGDAGTALALHAAATGTAPASGWDACLLIS